MKFFVDLCYAEHSKSSKLVPVAVAGLRRRGNQHYSFRGAVRPGVGVQPGTGLWDRASPWGLAVARKCVNRHLRKRHSLGKEQLGEPTAQELQTSSAESEASRTSSGAELGLQVDIWELPRKWLFTEGSWSP